MKIKYLFFKLQDMSSVFYYLKSVFVKKKPMNALRIKLFSEKHFFPQQINLGNVCSMCVAFYGCRFWHSCLGKTAESAEVYMYGR